MTLINTVSSTFEAEFKAPATHFIQAPGRVNLIGEHTDYNDGFVLPCAIDFQTVVAASKRDDNLIEVISADFGNQKDQFLVTEEITSHPEYMWANYIRGVVKCLIARGYKLGGANLVVSGNVPQGAGLSSSAALEVVIGQTFKTLYDLDISATEIALNGQQAENEFVGCNCGIMDQLISAEGQKDHALLLDCRSLETKAISMPKGLTVMIINSNIKRGLVDSEYNTRREQCEEAAAHFSVKALRDLDLETFNKGITGLDADAVKRARHVITENSRTLLAADALANEDMASLSKLMGESHASMRDDFEITVPAIDYLVDLIGKEMGTAGGVRMTGGGFGGCVVAVMPPELVAPIKTLIEDNYQNETGIKEDIFICCACDGTGEVTAEVIGAAV